MGLLIFGPPGAGKGTVAKQATAALGIPHISTGDMLRAGVASGNELGRKVESILGQGGLVPDDIMIELVRERLGQADVAGGWLLDGFPRTLPQAEALGAMLADLGQAIDKVLLIDVPGDTIVDRLGGRRVCLNCGGTYHVTFAAPKTEGKCDACGQDLVWREDDRPETIRRRLATYEAQTAPLIAFYEELGVLLRFDNSGRPEDTVRLVLEALHA